LPTKKLDKYLKLKQKIENFILQFGNLAEFRSVIWLYFVRQFGYIQFSNLANFYNPFTPNGVPMARIAP